jgi:hypothetical protein
MQKNTRQFLLTAMAGFTLAAASPTVRAAELSEAELFFELNNTDGDLGIHASIDGEPWKKLKIEDPKGRTILEVIGRGRLRQQGLTQLFLESAEPSFDELDPAEFFLRFPEGEYEIEAKSLEGEELEGEVMLSHVLAAPVGNVAVNGEAAAENCDALPLPSVSEPILIDWDPAMTSHPTLGKSGPVEIVRYQFFVEQGEVKFAVDLPPTQTQFQVPSEIIALGDTDQPFKFEIIARTSTGNNTAIENCFEVE